MRVALLILFALAVSFALAAPTPKAPPPIKDRRKSPGPPRLFAQRLALPAGQVAQRYVRPISREQLLEAAVTALYREARRPVPFGLRERVKAACTAAAVVPAPDQPLGDA